MNSLMHDRADLLRWSDAFESMAAVRTLVGKKHTRKSIKHVTRDGKPITLTTTHRCVWMAIVILSPNIEGDMANTWASNDQIARFGSLTAGTVSDAMGDFVALGMVRRRPRGYNQTHSTWIFIEPISPDQDFPEEEADDPELEGESEPEPEEEEEFEPEEEAGSVRRRSNTQKPVTAEGPTMEDLVGLVRGYWKDHPDLKQSGCDELLHQHLEECVELAGSVDICGQVINFAAEDKGLRTCVASSDPSRGIHQKMYVRHLKHRVG